MSIVETFHGYIETTQDSLLVLEACRRCLLPKISRRLQEKERKLVRSGSVFVFDEKDSGIKRWTDGLVWSPSRILGNFLIYRELDKKIPKRKRALIDSGHTRLRSNSADQSSSDRHKERQLVGSLSDAYNFKEDGLIKKTMSLIVDGTPLHLISYYHPDDVVARKLRTPSTVPELVNLEISPELLVRQNFRIPPVVEPDQYAQPIYQTSPGFSAAAGQLAKPSPASRSLSLPSNDYMHHQLYTRHNSISQFNHSTTNYPTDNSHQQQQQDHHLPQLGHHRESVELDRSKLVFDPMYNVTTYTLPSPTSSPNTPLPVSMPPNPSSSIIAPHSADHNPTNPSATNVSMPYHPSSSYSYDYSRLQQQQQHQKPATENHGRILNLPTLTRQDHTSITSLLSNDSPTHHHHSHEQQQSQHYHSSPDHDLQPPALSYPDYYGSNATQGVTHQTNPHHQQQHHHQQQQHHHHHHHSPTGSAHLPQPMSRLYSLDDSAMQWI